MTHEQVRCAWRVFASTFCVEASEMSVSARHFSLPEFLSDCLNETTPT
jgi:hypothetical protein